MQEDDIKIDVGETDEQAQEIDLDAPAPEQSLEEEQIDVEETQDDSQPVDASAQSDEQSDVQASEQKKELDEYSDKTRKQMEDEKIWSDFQMKKSVCRLKAFLQIPLPK